MAKEKVCGIYRIENLVTHKSYIGQSVDIYDRWRDHKWALNNKQHNNSHLVRSWHKYKEYNFEFTIIERCSEDKFNDREVYWIEYYDSYYNGYNQTKGGDGCLGKVWTDEEIENVAEPVLQIDLDGNLIKRWPSIPYASRKLDINSRQIWNCANKHIRNTKKKNGKTYVRTTKTAGGYIWVYEKDFSNFNLDDYVDTRYKPILQHDLNWNLIKQWPSSESTKEIGYTPTAIAGVCKGKFKQAYGYIWTYADIEIDKYKEWYYEHFDVKYIAQYDLSGNLIKIWDSPKDTERDGFRACSVREVLNGNQIKHKGFTFKYISWKELKI